MRGERAKPRVYVGLRLASDVVARIEAECQATLHNGLAAREELIAALGDVEGLFVSTMQRIDAEVLDAAPRLRVVSNYGVGYDNVDVPAATARGVLVCNTPGVLTDAVADLTLSLVVMLARRLAEAVQFVREGNWTPGKVMPLGTDVGGKTLGIVGLGRIGRAVAQRARACHMEVSYHDLFREPPAGLPFCRYRPLDDLLRESDFVTLHVNLSDETRKLIGARELALMKPSAYLINTSRGQVIDQSALTEALRAGTIAGAALDVLEREPPPPDEPLLQLPSAIVLPHVGSATRETRKAMLDLAVDNLLLAVRGETPRTMVNPEALEARRAGG